jgi:DNA mismatch repair protein MutS2
MNRYALNVLEYGKIKELLRQYALSDRAKAFIDRLEPSTDGGVIEGWLRETTEARRIIDSDPGIPLSALTGIERLLEKSGKGMVLAPEELTAITGLLECVRRMKRFMAGMQLTAPGISAYAASMDELRDLYDEIDRCIADGRVDDRASAELHRIRKKLGIVEDRIKQKLNSILNAASAAGYLQEAVISTRNGRYVIPVKREYRRNLEGSVLDTSSSGSTVFMEPSGIARLQEELNLLRLEEENEVYRILAWLTGLADGYKREISIDVEALAHYDFIFAKAKYGRALDSRSPVLNSSSRILVKGGKHPLIGRSAVPLDFHIGGDYRALVITGPNTGGKTVALKTVGLLTLMVQSGLHVPVGEGSEFAVFADVLADIGDGQSIEQSLSTFSSHVMNISAILKRAGPDTLVIMDEVGAGTDPSEGMGFAAAVLEEVYAKGATIVATTHYSELKEFASVTPGFSNGCMGFDINSLKPLYTLKIGQPGESNAFLVALRLGMSSRIIERAHEITYKEKKKYDTIPPVQETGPAEDVTAVSRPTPVEEAKRAKKPHRPTEEPRKQAEKSFSVGDCVYISSMGRTGIVCEAENGKGELMVMVMKKKFRVNKKRLSVYIDGKELYPEDYDFDIVLESKDDRKKKKLMSKRHAEGVVIERTTED